MDLKGLEPMIARLQLEKVGPGVLLFIFVVIKARRMLFNLISLFFRFSSITEINENKKSMRWLYFGFAADD